jgi:hypothetical protein
MRCSQKMTMLASIVKNRMKVMPGRGSAGVSSLKYTERIVTAIRMSANATNLRCSSVCFCMVTGVYIGNIIRFCE